MQRRRRIAFLSSYRPSRLIDLLYSAPSIQDNVSVHFWTAELIHVSQIHLAPSLARVGRPRFSVCKSQADQLCSLCLPLLGCRLQSTDQGRPHKTAGRRGTQPPNQLRTIDNIKASVEEKDLCLEEYSTVCIYMYMYGRKPG